MKKKILLILVIIVLTCSCTFFADYVDKEGQTIKERIILPEGYNRVKTIEGSYQHYLQNYPLKEHGRKIHYYNGKTKTKYSPGILNMDVGEKNLQQCADCIIRLWAEYNYFNKEYDKIHFNLTNGFRVDYTKWIEGFRVAVDGNDTYWVENEKYLESYETFRQYLDLVYTYAGTYSLSQEMIQVDEEDINIGDIFIIPADIIEGKIGHAVIIVDMAVNIETGEKIFVLAQGSTPAQEMHIIANKKNPWIRFDSNGEVNFTRWVFKKDNIMRFNEE